MLNYILRRLLIAMFMLIGYWDRLFCYYQIATW